MPETSASSADEGALLGHIAILASRDFAGRAPGTEGERATVAYLDQACARNGLTALLPDGGFRQRVPVVGARARCDASFVLGEHRELVPLEGRDFVARSSWESVRVQGDVVFVGFGIVAPEYGWNDFENADVRGKTVLVLAGDPRRPLLGDSDEVDETFFRGKGMTYYGRWRYKFEEAARQGARSCFIIHHDDERAGYPFSVIRDGWALEHIDSGLNEDAMAVEGWLSRDFAEDLFNELGANLEEMVARAHELGNESWTLSCTSSVSIQNTVRSFESSNVLGAVVGYDPDLAHECVVVVAHWDHLGEKSPGRPEAGFYPGAIDNASGVAALLEMSRMLALSPARRTVIFLYTTLEETGLTGAKYYTQHPAMPLDRTRAVINIDQMNVWGPTSDLVSTGRGHSDLDSALDRVAARRGRTVVDDPDPDKGYFYRSDHLEFMRHGVPALFFAHPGLTYLDRPRSFGADRRKRFVAEEYHTSADGINGDWDLRGMVADVELFFDLIHEIADDPSDLEWTKASEFSPELRGQAQPAD